MLAILVLVGPLMVAHARVVAPAVAAARSRLRRPRPPDPAP
jgi:hypothetical protein